LRSDFRKFGNVPGQFVEDSGKLFDIGFFDGYTRGMVVAAE
jgi:hypothetical protein